MSGPFRLKPNSAFPFKGEMSDFEKAFSTARKTGKEQFTYKGEKFHTKTKEEISDIAGPETGKIGTTKKGEKYTIADAGHYGGVKSPPGWADKDTIMIGDTDTYRDPESGDEHLMDWYNISKAGKKKWKIDSTRKPSE